MDQDNEPADKSDEDFDVALINPGLSLDIAFFFFFFPSNGTNHLVIRGINECR